MTSSTLFTQRLPKLDKSLMQGILPFVSLALVGIAGYVIHSEIAKYSLSEIKSSLGALSPQVITGMIALTGLSYLMLSLYDKISLEYAGAKIPYRTALLTSFLSYALSNNVGHALVTGGSMRYRLYTAAQVPWDAVAKVIVFCTVTYLLAATLIMTSMLPFAEATIGLPANLTQFPTTLITASGAAVLLAWGALVWFYNKPLLIAGRSFELPTPAIALKQLVVGVADICIASFVLFLPVQQLTGMGYETFLLVYISAQMTGLASQVPGGIGIFEASFLYLASDTTASSSLLAALLAYRLIYYFVPLIFAGVVLIGYESASHLSKHGRRVGQILAGVEPVVPQVLSVLLLIGGGVLLVSGATPADPGRLHWLKHIVPMPLIEFSHLTGSLSGLAMLLLSRAVWQRIDSAYYAAAAALSIGAVASLAKGWDFEEATIMLLLLAMVLPARKHFYRKSSLMRLDYSPPWIVLICLALGLSTWMGFFSYRHVEYSDQLWWEFALHGNASRFLRSLVAISVAVVGFTGYRLLTRSVAELKRPTGEELARAAAIAEAANDTNAHLVMTGDKYLLWSETGNSFVMFDIAQGYWVAMGDPVGRPEEFDLLTKQFRDLADLHAAKTAFYQVGERNVAHYVDLGMSLIKLGEEAHVDLGQFGLEGSKRTGLRHAHNKSIKEGLLFEIIPAAEVPNIIPDLKAISDAWLSEKHGREKRFSLGFFHEDYITRCDAAVVKKDGRIVAFANIWKTSNHEELSVDLMRYARGLTNGIMEFLIVELMLWGKTQGYKSFNLGMAPLAGLEKHALAPLWHKIGNTVFRFGSEFYNFEGLLQYKSKFSPVWQSRYLVAPSGLSQAQALLAATALISSAPKGTILQ